MSPRTLTVSATALVALGSMAWLGSCSGKTERELEPLAAVQAVRVKRADVHQKVASDAVLYPWQQAAIVPKINSPVLKFYVDRGSHVQAGQLLAVLENRDLEAAVAENKGTYDEAQANYESTIASNLPEQIQKAELDLKNAKAALQAAQQLYDGSKNLYDQGALAKVQLNQAEVGLTQAQAQLQTTQQQLEKLQSVGQRAQAQAAQGLLAAAKGRYQNAEAQLAYSEIRSPITGVVTDRPLYAGEMPASGAALITVMDISQMKAKAHISPKEAGPVRIGNSAALSVPGVEGEVPGKVTVVSPSLDNNSTTVEVWVQTANRGERLRPGIGVHLTIITSTAKDALIIPSAALLTDPDGTTSVMVVNGDKPERRDVKTGIRDEDNIQITEGLKAGEQVVTEGVYELSQEDPDVLKRTKLQIGSPKTPQEGGGKESD